MHNNLSENIMKIINQNHTYIDYFKEIKVKQKTMILREGEKSNFIYYIKKGCLRLWYNNDGKEITFQFFFENQAFSGLYGNVPSLFNLESIEQSNLLLIKVSDFKRILNDNPEMKNLMIDNLLKILEKYSMEFLSQIKNSSQKRYIDLIENHPEIIKRIPQQYIASYLGITPISLSRIRKRISIS